MCRNYENENSLTTYCQNPSVYAFIAKFSSASFTEACLKILKRMLLWPNAIVSDACFEYLRILVQIPTSKRLKSYGQTSIYNSCLFRKVLVKSWSSRIRFQFQKGVRGFFFGLEPGVLSLEAARGIFIQLAAQDTGAYKNRWQACARSQSNTMPRNSRSVVLLRKELFFRQFLSIDKYSKRSKN